MDSKQKRRLTEEIDRYKSTKLMELNISNKVLKRAVKKMGKENG